MQKQVEDQHRTENVEHNSPQAARIDMEQFSEGEPRSAEEQDGQNIVGKGGGENRK